MKILKTFYPQSLTKRIFFVLLLVLYTPFLSFSQTTVNTLAELLPYLDNDNANVKLAPGTYTITASDITAGKYTSYTIIEENKAYALFLFSGNNSTYDFTGVTVNILTEVYNAINSDAGDFFELHVIGNNNVIKNLTMVDVGSVHDAPKYGNVNVVMDGSNNTIQGFHITSKGSYPYGYGDAFGKGGASVISHKKHSSFLIRGESNYALNDTIIHRSYGHCMFMQAASNPKIEGCYLEGEMRSTDDMLAEEGTGSPADKVNFMTIWGYRLPPGYMLSTGEAGIRAYNAGQTVIDGVDYSRGTSNVTVLNCTIKYLRTGVTIAHATGTKYVEGCTAIGCENGFSLASGNVVDCYADCTYGPVYASTYENDRNYHAEITILPPSDPYYNGSKSVAYIGGSGHNITLKGSEVIANQDLKIKVGGDKGNIRLLYGNLPHQNDFAASSINLNNLTNFPVYLSNKSSNVVGTSGGMVMDYGTNNNVVHTAVSVSVIQAEDYSNMNGVSTESATDIGGGENVTSIEAGDWLEYEIDVPYAGTYNMAYRVASAANNGDFTLSVGGESLENLSFSATGGGQTWRTINSETPFYLNKGVQTLKITASSNNWKLNWLDLSLECADIVIVPFMEEFNALGESFGKTQSNETTIFPGNSITLSPEPTVGGSWSWFGPNNYTSNARVITLSDIQKSQSGEYVVSHTNACGQTSQEKFTVNVSDAYVLEAEDYTNMSGVTVENTSDTNGGSKVSTIESGDWIEFELEIPFNAMYTLDYRVKGALSDASFVLNTDGSELETISFNSQLWTTESSSAPVYLKKGSQTLKISASSDNWEINWIKLNAIETVRACHLPFVYENVSASNELVEWSTGPMDISCGSDLKAHCVISSSADVSSSDYLNIYYKLDGGALMPISEQTGTISEMMVSSETLVGNTVELVIQSQTSSSASSYTVSKVLVLNSRDPLEKIEAEDYDDSDGTSTESTSDTGGGQNVGSIRDGNWLKFSNVNLSTANSVNLRLASTTSGSTVEIRIDSISGELIGKAEVTNTGNWQKWETNSVRLENKVGFYDVFLVFRNESSYVCNINWLQFSEAFIKGPTNPYERFEAEINDGQSGVTATTTSDIDGGDEVENIEDGDYVLFTALNLEQANALQARVASDSEGGVIEVRLGKTTGEIIAFIDVPNTGSTSTWQTEFSSISEIEGENDVYFIFRGDGNDLFKLNWFKFINESSSFPVLESEDYDESFGTILRGSTSDAADNGDGAILRYVQPETWIKFTDIDFTGVKSISTRYGTIYDDAKVEVRLDATDGELISTIALKNTDNFNNWQTTGTNISAVSGSHDVYFIFKAESSALVCNSNWFKLSGMEQNESYAVMDRMEAEAYSRANGTETLSTSDVDGVEELGAIQNSDWIMFKDVDLTGAVKVDLRVASPNDGCRMELRTGAYDGSFLSFISIPNTGSANNWETVTGNLFSSEGVHDVYIIFKGSTADLLNINWLQFKDLASGVKEKHTSNNVNIFPNPVKEVLTIQNAVAGKVAFYNTMGAKVFETTIKTEQESFNLSSMPYSTYYFVRIIKADGKVERFKLVNDLKRN